MTRRAARGGPSPLLVRVATVVALVVAVTGAGTGTGWALWSATATQRVQVTLGKTSTSLTGATPRVTTFTDRGAALTTSFVARNTGTVPADWTLSTSLPSGSSEQSRQLAAAIDVRMWAKTGTTCDVAPTGALVGTWAAAPTPTGRLGAGSTAEWCVRTVATSAAPAAARVNPILSLSVTSGGSWTALSEIRDLYQHSPTSWPVPVVTATCIANDVYYARLRFDPSPRPRDTWYAPYVGDRRVGTQLNTGDYPEFAFTRDDLPAVPFGDDRIRVDIRVMTGDVPGAVAAQGTLVPVYDANGLRNIQCG
ncbi:hypothetical protein [Frigoribacterium salinisoli]